LNRGLGLEDGGSESTSDSLNKASRTCSGVRIVGPPYRWSQPGRPSFASISPRSPKRKRDLGFLRRRLALAADGDPFAIDTAHHHRRFFLGRRHRLSGPEGVHRLRHLSVGPLQGIHQLGKTQYFRKRRVHLGLGPLYTQRL
jgi:hypothetical protein